MSIAAPRTAPAWKLLHAAHCFNRDNNNRSEAWRYLIHSLEPDNQQADKIEQALREQFAFETFDHGLTRPNNSGEPASAAGTPSEEYGYLLYGEEQQKLDKLFDESGAEWVSKRVRELQARFPAEAAAMGLAELVEPAPTAESSNPPTPRVVSSEKPDADQTPEKGGTSETKRRKQRRKRTGATKVPTLTEKQTEAMKLHGDCEGNIAEIARRMGVNRKSAEQHVKAAFKKLGRSIPRKASTKALPTGRRGEEMVSESDDRRE